MLGVAFPSDGSLSCHIDRQTSGRDTVIDSVREREYH